MSLLLTVVAANAGSYPASFTDAFPSDTIRILWWALGVLASIISAMWAGIGIWMIKKIIEHDRDIVAIKTRCEIEHEEDEL